MIKEVYPQLETDLQEAKSFGDLMGKNGAIKKLIKRALEAILESK